MDSFAFLKWDRFPLENSGLFGDLRGRNGVILSLFEIFSRKNETFTGAFRGRTFSPFSSRQTWLGGQATGKCRRRMPIFCGNLSGEDNLRRDSS